MKNVQKQTLKVVLRVLLGMELLAILFMSALLGQKNTGWAANLLFMTIIGILLFAVVIVLILLTSTFFLLREDCKNNRMNGRYLKKLALEWVLNLLVFFILSALFLKGHHLIEVQELLVIGLGGTFLFLLQRTFQYMRRCE